MTNNKQPEQPTNHTKSSRSFGISIGVTEFVFLLGIVLLAAGVFSAFGFVWTVIVIGATLVVSAWLMQFA
jgi:Flp pilus assembly protein TadB